MENADCSVCGSNSGDGSAAAAGGAISARTRRQSCSAVQQCACRQKKEGGPMADGSLFGQMSVCGDRLPVAAHCRCMVGADLVDDCRPAGSGGCDGWGIPAGGKGWPFCSEKSAVNAFFEKKLAFSAKLQYNNQALLRRNNIWTFSSAG